MLFTLHVIRFYLNYVLNVNKLIDSYTVYIYKTNIKAKVGKYVDFY